jgi:hypothetical protein
MMHGLLNAMRLQAMQADSKVVMMLGTVFGYNPNNYTAKVMLQPDNIETEALPIASPLVGNGWGFFAPPTDGDVVEVTFQEGDLSSGIIGLRLFTNSARPANVPSGEFQLIHQSGSFLKFHNDGSVEIKSSQNITAICGGDMTATVTGKMTATVTGKATIDAASVDIKGGGLPPQGVVQAECICALTGSPHVMVSSTVKASK